MAKVVFSWPNIFPFSAFIPSTLWNFFPHSRLDSSPPIIPQPLVPKKVLFYVAPFSSILLILFDPSASFFSSNKLTSLYKTLKDSLY